MATVAVLPPGESLISPLKPHNRPRKTNNNTAPTNNNNDQPENRTVPSGRKRRTGKSPPSSASVCTDAPPRTTDLVPGQVKILRRGEQLPVPKENQPVPVEEAVGTTTRMAEPGLAVGFYASIASPPASSVPHPNSILKSKRVVGVEMDEATSSLRRFLGLTNL